MKPTLKFLTLLISMLFLLYHAYFFVLPSVTVINLSDSTIQNARVELPSSGMGFGKINMGEENTIHYELEQLDGTYRYRIELAPEGLPGKVLTGECGYVTNNEVNKRFVLEVANNKVECR